MPASKTYSSGSFNVDPSFAEVMEILSVPSSPELEHPCKPLAGSYYADDSCTYQSDVSSEQNCDKIKACDLTKIDGDINILVIGAEGVGKSGVFEHNVSRPFR